MDSSEQTNPPTEPAQNPALSSSSANTSFLFVNESSSTAGKKIGRRSDIKSHVRNHVVQRQKKSSKKKEKDVQLPGVIGGVDSELLVGDDDDDEYYEREGVQNAKSKGKARATTKGKEKAQDSQQDEELAFQTSKQGVPMSQWSSKQKATTSSSRRRTGTRAGTGSGNRGAPEDSEASWYQIHKSGGQFQLPLNPLPKPNVVSDVLERAIAYTLGLPLEPRGMYGESQYADGVLLNPQRRQHGQQQQQQGDNFYYPNTTLVGNSGERTPSERIALPTRREGYEEIAEGDNSGRWIECSICDDPQKAWMICDEHGSVWERQERRQGDYDYDPGYHNEGESRSMNVYVGEVSKRRAYAERPLDQLGVLGHGRVDPFVSYPTLVDDPSGTLNELFDHSVTYLLPGLIVDSSPTTPSLLTTSWMTAARHTPLLFHALVFSASIHLSFLLTSTIQPNSKVPLTHKQAVITELNKVLSSPTERIKDEVILAILILSSHEVMDLDPGGGNANGGEKGGVFDSPLRKMQWLNVYGNIRNVQEHLMAVMRLVNLRGGVESLELYGLAELLIGGDVVAATTSLSPPAFAPLQRSKLWLSTLRTWSTSPPRPRTLLRGRSFPLFTSHGLTPALLSILSTTSAVTTAIASHLSGEHGCISLNLIARTRTACQQHLLSLPAASDIPDILGAQTTEQPCVYECVRLTANIFNIAVIFPIPRPSAVLQTLVRQLVVAICESGVEHYVSPRLDSLMLWMLMLGGIAAVDVVDKEWYVERLVGLARRLGFRSADWEGVEGVLGGFLWLGSACGRGGRGIWGVVGERLDRLDVDGEVGMWLAGSE